MMNTRQLKTVLALALTFVILGSALPAAQTTSSYTDNIWQVFMNPPLEYKSRPIWFWTTDLVTTPDAELVQLVQDAYNSGYSGFGIIPCRNRDLYLSDTYFDKYELVLAKARELGMKATLYDDFTFPSYRAGGVFVKKYPEYVAKRVDMIAKPVTVTGPGSASMTAPFGTVMSFVAMESTTGKIIDLTGGMTQEEERTPDAPATTLSVKNISASSEYNTTNHSAKAAFDGDSDSRWNAASAHTGEEWLEITYSEPVAFDTLVIKEAFGRIRDWTVQTWNGTAYGDVATGTGIGNEKTINFAAATSAKVRFLIKSYVGDSPSLFSMEIYNEGVRLLPQGPILDDHVYPHYLRLSADGLPSGEWKLLAFVCVPAPTDGVNYLDGDSVAKFIEATHEAYYERFKDDYFPVEVSPGVFEGGVFDSTFYDEPFFWCIGRESAGRMWSHKMNDEFIKFHDDKYGDPSALYPAIFGLDIGENTLAARAAFNSLRAELFSREYVKQIADWCRDRGLTSSGHVMYEEAPNPVYQYGDLMKVFKHQDMPGIDYIYYYADNQRSCKVVTSAGYNWDHGLFMTETYGAMGEEMGIENLYRPAMDQFTKGLNFMMPHAIWSDARRSAVQFPPELSSRNELYGPELPAYNEYIGRCQLLLQKGRHVADIAVLYPIDYLQSQYYLNTKEPQYGNPPDNNYMDVGTALTDRLQRDFTFLHPEVLGDPARCVVENGVIHLQNRRNYEDYRVFILPGTRMISKECADQLKTFFESGGSIISAGQLPYRATATKDDSHVAQVISRIFDIPETELPHSVDVVKENDLRGSGKGLAIKLKGLEPGDKDFTKYDVAGVAALGVALDKALDVYDVRFENIPLTLDGFVTYIHKVKEDTDIYFLANSSLTAYISGAAYFRGKVVPSVWDPHTGTKSAVLYEHITKHGQDVTKINFDLPPVYSVFIVNDPGMENQHLTGIKLSSDTEKALGVGGITDLLDYRKHARLSVTGTFSDGNKVVDLGVMSALCEFKSLNPEIATVSASGCVTGTAPGKAIIKVTSGEFEETAEIEVIPITLEEIVLTSDLDALKTNGLTQLTVEGKLSDGVVFDLSALPGLTVTPDTPGLVAITDNKKCEKVAGQDNFTVRLTALLTVGGEIVNSNSVRLHAFPLTNVALATNGATVTASSAHGSFPAENVINGDRTGKNWNSGTGGWNSAGTFPQTLEITFNERKFIDEINVFTLQDGFSAGQEPRKDTVFYAYGITEFKLRYWDEADGGWKDIPGCAVTGNNRVWRQFKFDPIDVEKIQLSMTNSTDGNTARVVEIEAWEAYRSLD